MHNVEKLVKEFALEVGFDLVSIASTAPFEDHRDVTLRRIGQGLMDGLPWFTGARVNRGANPQELLPGARSIISVGLSYYLTATEAKSMEGKVARYA